ncbi:MAG: hypothetical protein QF741_01475, partial [Candidatus Peribacteraceae bacterium]|nr:hypothetical protein [Candidatus Peribacteraceae bacterium]
MSLLKGKISALIQCLEFINISFLLIFTAFLGVFFWFLNFNEILGHDFVYFFARLHAGQWHFARQGLNIFYFTPHFCGGVPQFGNPQDLFYSLPQFLAIAGMDIWRASQLSMFASMILGYFGWYLFGRDIVRLNKQWSHVFALIIIAQGFYLMHMIAGHLVFFGMPLIGLLLWLIFDRRKCSVRSLITKAAIFSLTSAFIMYSGGYSVALMAIVAFILFLPFELILNSSKGRLKVLAVRSAACGLGAIFINLSKLTAVWSFMRFIPRAKPFERFTDGCPFEYMAKAFWAIPQMPELFSFIGMPDRATHEYSLYLSPIVLVGIVIGFYLLWQNKSKFKSSVSKSILVVIVTLVFINFFAQLARGYGVIVTPLENLPIFKSLHINVRFLYPFSFILTAAGVYALMQWASVRKNELLISISAGIITVVAFIIAYYPLMQTNELPRVMPVQTHRELVGQYQDFKDKDVTQMLMLKGGLEELIPIFSGSNHIHCYESLFWQTETFKNNPITGGAPAVQSDGKFNIYNPACLQYPEANECKPGDRIKAEDGENARQFLSGQKTTWKIPIWQKLSNWISLISLIAVLAILGL